MQSDGAGLFIVLVVCPDLFQTIPKLGGMSMSNWVFVSVDHQSLRLFLGDERNGVEIIIHGMGVNVIRVEEHLGEFPEPRDSHDVSAPEILEVVKAAEQDAAMDVEDDGALLILRAVRIVKQVRDADLRVGAVVNDIVDLPDARVVQVVDFNVFGPVVEVKDERDDFSTNS